MAGEGEGVPVDEVDLAKDDGEVGTSGLGFFFGGLSVSQVGGEAGGGTVDQGAVGEGLAVAPAGKELGTGPGLVGYVIVGMERCAGVETDLEFVFDGVEQEGDLGVGLDLGEFGGADVDMEAEGAVGGVDIAESDDAALGALGRRGRDSDLVEGVFAVHGGGL